MASSTVGIGLTIGAVAQGSVGAVLGSTRRSLDGLTRSSRALELAQTRVGRNLTRGLTTQRAGYERLGRAMASVRRAHEGLTVAAARSNAAIASGQQSWGKLAGTAMAAWGTVKGVVATAGQAAHFADTLRDTRIKGRLSAEQETALGEAIRVNVATTGQSRDELAAGSHQLITGGASFEEARSQIGLMGATMTALRTSSEETTGAMLALRDMGATDREAMQSGIERLVAVGERGQFTPDMMIRAFAQLGDTIKATGLKGDTAIAELAAGLQIAEASMGAANAQAGLQSWLSGLNDPKVAAAYERAGVDYKTSMAELQKSGMSQYQASLELAGAFVRDSLSARDQQALLSGEDDGRISTMLAEMGLGEVFKDANAARFALSIHNNRDTYREMTGASGAGSLDALKTLREESPIEQLKALKNAVSEMAVDIGGALLPSILSVTQALVPLVAGIADFIRAHPNVVSGIAAVVAGIVAIRVATVATTFAWRQSVLAFTTGVKAFHLLRSGLALAQAQLALFRSGTLLARGGLLAKLGAVRLLAANLVGALATGLRSASVAALGFGRAMLMNARAAMTATVSAAGGLARTLAGSLVRGLSMAGRAALWLGRALMMNPIGLAITAIAGAAFLVVKYWQPIKGFFGRLWNAVTGIFKRAWDGITGFFSGLWTRITHAVDGGLVGIGKLILDWSPLGLFYKAFSGVLGWFGVELPDSFSAFGGKVITAFTSGIAHVFDGAWQGIKDLFGSAWEGVTGIASAALDGIQNLTSRAWQGIKAATASAWQGVTNVTASAWNGITSTAQSVWGGVTGFFGEVWDSVSNTTRSTWDGIGSGLSSAWDTTRDAAESLWGGIGGFFSGVWDSAKSAFDGGISGVAERIANFSPLAHLRQTFSGAIDWLHNQLPSEFSESGKALMEGLVGGITNMVGSVKDSIVGVGESVVGWFRDKLGINSPSRVFMDLGANVSQGAAQGISGAQHLVREAALGMAAATAVTLAAPTLAAPVLPAPMVAEARAGLSPLPHVGEGAPSGAGEGSPPATAAASLVASPVPPPPAARAVSNSDAGVVIHFSPTINVQAADGDGVEAQLEKALQKFSGDLRRQVLQILRDANHDAHRRGYGNIGGA